MFSKIQLFLTKSDLQIYWMFTLFFEFEFFGGGWSLIDDFVFTVVGVNVDDGVALFVSEFVDFFGRFGCLFRMFFLPFLLLLKLLFLQSSFRQRSLII
jgi:hypothetical protein